MSLIFFPMSLTPASLPLETERLLLRDYVAADWEEVHSFNRHESFWRFLPIEPQTEQTTKDFIAAAQQCQQDSPRLDYQLAVVRKESGAVIGGVRLNLRNADLPVAALGYSLDPQFWGQGFATEAAATQLRLGFEHFQLHRIFAFCDPENPASARVMEKLGMTREGLLRENLLLRGAWRDSYIYSILDWEYRPQSGQAPSGQVPSGQAPSS